MPPLPAIADVFEVSTLGTWAGRACDHRINWLLAAGSGTHSDQAEIFAHADVDAMNNHIMAFLPPEYTLLRSRCVYLGDTTTLAREFVSNTTGGSVEFFGVHSICWTVRHPAASRGRGKDGRTNFPGPSNGDIDGTTGRLTADAQTELQGAWDLYYSAMQSSVLSGTGIIPLIVILNAGHTAFQRPPGGSTVDSRPNTHRRWEPRD